VRGRDVAEAAPVLAIGREPNGVREHELPHRPLHGAVFEGRTSRAWPGRTTRLRVCPQRRTPWAPWPRAPLHGPSRRGRSAVARGTAQRCCRTQGAKIRPLCK
jgi:hypothetical protein